MPPRPNLVVSSQTYSAAEQVRLQSTLAQAVKVAIIATDLTGSVTYWNPFAEDLYGWPAKEVLGRNIMGITVSAETEQQANSTWRRYWLAKVGRESSRCAARTELT